MLKLSYPFSLSCCFALRQNPNTSSFFNSVPFIYLYLIRAVVLCLSTYETASHVTSWKLFFNYYSISPTNYIPVTDLLLPNLYFSSFPLLYFLFLIFSSHTNTFIMEHSEGFDHKSVYIKAFWVFSRHILVLHFMRQRR